MGIENSIYVTSRLRIVGAGPRSNWAVKTVCRGIGGLMFTKVDIPAICSLNGLSHCINGPLCLCNLSFSNHQQFLFNLTNQIRLLSQMIQMNTPPQIFHFIKHSQSRQRALHWTKNVFISLILTLSFHQTVHTTASFCSLRWTATKEFFITIGTKHKNIHNPKNQNNFHGPHKSNKNTYFVPRIPRASLTIYSLNEVFSLEKHFE